MAIVDQGSDAFPFQVGDLYSRWTLDGLVEVGYAASVDFVSRPQLYQGDDIPEEIVTLRMSYGTNPKFPNTQQRQALMLPVFGRSDGLKPDASNLSSQFHLARKKLIDACVAFTERHVDTGLPMLEDRVRSALVPFRAYFEGLKGRSLSLGGEQVKVISDTAYNLLRSVGVAKVFGLIASNAHWPLTSTDPNGAKLVEAATGALPMPADYKVNYIRFILLQRVSQEGRAALSVVLKENSNENQDLHTLISRVYTWGSSLRDFQMPS